MKAISSHAAAAKAIRQFIKAKGLNATVRSDSFAGGNSVSVDLFDATPALRREVEAFAHQFQYGHFDGMTDSYEHSNRRDDIPQVKFVSVTAQFSDEVKQAAWDTLRGYIAGADALPAAYAQVHNVRIWNDYAPALVYRFLMGSMLPEQSAAFWQRQQQKAA